MGKSGVGMPAALLLEQFAIVLNDAFGHGDNYFCTYQVGSSLERATWRDVDVRVILDDERYAAEGYGDPERSHGNAKWIAMTLAFSALGRQLTGLPIDFQLQQQTHANAKNIGGKRSALGLWRHVTERDAPDPNPSEAT